MTASMLKQREMQPICRSKKHECQRLHVAWGGITRKRREDVSSDLHHIEVGSSYQVKVYITNRSSASNSRRTNTKSWFGLRQQANKYKERARVWTTGEQIVVAGLDNIAACTTNALPCSPYLNRFQPKRGGNRRAGQQDSGLFLQRKHKSCTAHA